MKIWDCGSPLYDSYELASVTQLIERQLMFLPSSLGGSKRRLKLHHENHIHAPPSTSKGVVSTVVSLSCTPKTKGEKGVFGRLSGCIGRVALCGGF
uniref:Uncharacterized protein n=1 Tax=Chenopodium quinoa TaxID=63459 RepID=A0A803M4W6_CHEQI